MIEIILTLLVVWTPYFLVIAIPGMIMGWLLSKLRLSSETFATALIVTSCVLGFIASKLLFRSEMEIHRHIENIVFFGPPIGLAIFVGLWFSLGPNRQDK